MIRKATLALILTTLVIGCSKSESNTTNSGGNSGSVKLADGKIEKGDRVVIPSGATKSMFLEADVLTVEGSRVGVSVVKKNAKTAQIESADISEVYEVPGKGQKTEVKPGDIVLVKDEDSEYATWLGAEVLSVSETGATIKKLAGSMPPRNAPGDFLIKPSEKTISSLKGSGETSNMLAKATKHRPVLVEGYKPKMGDKILGEPALAGYWYSGAISKLEEARGGGALVWATWDDPNVKSTERVYTVIPLANAAKLPTPVVGQYVLVRPASPARWPYAEVTAVNGTSLDVKLEDGTSRTVKAGDFWPLEPNPR